MRKRKIFRFINGSGFWIVCTVLLVVGLKNKSACLSHILGTPSHRPSCFMISRYVPSVCAFFRSILFLLMPSPSFCCVLRCASSSLKSHFTFISFYAMRLERSHHFFHSFSFIYAFKICFHFTSDKSQGETLWGIRLVERFWAFHALVPVHQSALPTFC